MNTINEVVREVLIAKPVFNQYDEFFGQLVGADVIGAYDQSDCQIVAELDVHYVCPFRPSEWALSFAPQVKDDVKYQVAVVARTLTTAVEALVDISIHDRPETTQLVIWKLNDVETYVIDFNEKVMEAVHYPKIEIDNLADYPELSNVHGTYMDKIDLGSTLTEVGFNYVVVDKMWFSGGDPIDDQVDTYHIVVSPKV